MRKMFVCVLSILSVVVLTSDAQATGLLGERYASIGVRSETAIISDSGFGVALNANVPLQEHLDLGLSFEAMFLEDSRLFSIAEDKNVYRTMVYATGYLDKTQKLSPFATVGVIAVNVDDEAETDPEDDSGVGPLAGGGVDIALSEQGTLRLSALYYYGFTNTYRVTASYNYWFSEAVGMSVSVGLTDQLDNDEDVTDDEGLNGCLALRVRF